MGDFFLLSGIAFLFRFLPVFLIIYYLVPERRKNEVLFFGSCLFYACGEPVWLVLLLFLTVANYAIGQTLYASGYQKRRRKKKSRSIRAKERARRNRLISILLMDAGFLVVFKAILYVFPEFRVPVGMSFYIFKMISYQVDLYRMQPKERPGFFDTVAYFTMFPQLTQGPIMRYGEGFPFRLKEEKGIKTAKERFLFWMERLEEGLFYVCAGFCMKALLADKLGAFWHELAGLGYESISTPLAWLGAYAYTFQLYFDFWGYSLIAAGIGIMLGFPFIVNFNHPYAAANISDFYRRWHVTLGSWFKDYVYIPLGGSRGSSFKTCRNLLVVWFLTGFWHGGTLNFLLWGMILGGLVVFEKQVFQKQSFFKTFMGKFAVWFLIPLTWVIFALQNLRELPVYFARLFPIINLGKTLNPLDYQRYIGNVGPILIICVILCIPQVFGWMEKHRKNYLVCLGLAAVFCYAAYTVILSGSQAFLYFNF
ncbi:MAG: MBOAT family protein [Lachnospiraceae bacterium]|nr:MBOAT family protein [Lachnospiraceae bacterium]